MNVAHALARAALRFFRRGRQAEASRAPEYATRVFIDTNIVLEGKRLEELPWREVDPTGPILAAFTPTTLAEVDSKKRDGRLGTRAREFNRLIAAAAFGKDQLLISGPPAVYLGIVACERIPWDQYDDLDPQSGDARIVAEILNARGASNARRQLLASHDINPLAMASRRGIEVLHVSDAWLRPPEPSKAEREAQRLKARVATLEKTEPELSLKIESPAPNPAVVYRARPLSSEEQERMREAILDDNPRPDNNAFSFTLDGGLSRRWDKYEETAIPQFVADFHTKLEVTFGQAPLTITVANRGDIRADNLVLKVTASSGWFNAKAIFTPLGPRAPRQDIFGMAANITPVPKARGKHEVHSPQKVRRVRSFEYHCEDFRHGREWAFEGVLWLDPGDTSECVVRAVVTAANLHGEVTHEWRVAKVVKDVDAKDLADLASRKLIERPHIRDLLDNAIATEDFSRVELDTDDGR